MSSKLEFQPFGPPEEEGRRRVLCTTSFCFCAAARQNALKWWPKPQEKPENPENLVSERPIVKQNVSISSDSFAVDLKIQHLNMEAYSHNFQAEIYDRR